jgi:hypothetical protein
VQCNMHFQQYLWMFLLSKIMTLML